MQKSSHSRIFNPPLIGASPITDASLVDGEWLMVEAVWHYQPSTLNYQPTQRSQGVISSARRFAKAEVRGASPRESASAFGAIANGKLPISNGPDSA
jgi:hypothetical protein